MEKRCGKFFQFVRILVRVIFSSARIVCKCSNNVSCLSQVANSVLKINNFTKILIFTPAMRSFIAIDLYVTLNTDGDEKSSHFERSFLVYYPSANENRIIGITQSKNWSFQAFFRIFGGKSWTFYFYFI